MSDDAQPCPACGARIPAGAEACDLCGTSVEARAESASGEADEPGADLSAAAPDAPASEAPASKVPASKVPDDPETPDAVYCNACGWENPAGANYCSQCGGELQDVTGASAASSSAEPAAGTRAVAADLPTGPAASEEDEGDAADEPSDPQDEQVAMGAQILTVVGAALVLVLGLFFATQWSQQYEWGSESSSTPRAGPEATASPSQGGGAGGPSAAAGASGGGGMPASPQAAAAQDPTDLSTLVDELSGPVEGPVADQIDSLETAIEGAGEGQRRQLRAQLVQLYIGAGTPGRAARLQVTLAEQTGRVEDRRRAADLLYRWMRQVEQQGDRARIADVARHVADAYAAVVDQRPDDLDARTRMGEAYMLTNSPMKGIQAINQVLADDSTFVPARFQKGLALLQINRLDQAVTQFQRVMENASQSNPFYQQAKRAIEVIREQTGSGGGGAPGGAQGADS
jgi:ribosomal protein L40E